MLLLPASGKHVARAPIHAKKIFMNVSAALCSAYNKIRPMELPAPITFIVMAKKLAKVAFVLPVRFPIRELGNRVRPVPVFVPELVVILAVKQHTQLLATPHLELTASLVLMETSATVMKFVPRAHA